MPLGGGVVFHRHKQILCCRAAPLAKRLDFMKKVVEPALFWCAGSWNLRTDQYTKLRGVQRSMISRMIGFNRGEDEHIEAFMRRTNATITSLMSRHEVVSWDSMARRHVFMWAGWLARIRLHDKDRITLFILAHKDLDYVHDYADRHGGRQHHGRFLKVWRWESILRNFAATHFHERWQDKALDEIEWKNITEQIL